jgi:hypothetical protein
MIAGLLGGPVQTLAGGVGIMTAGGAHGVVGTNDLKVTQRGAGANMSVDVPAGFAFVSGTSILAQGTYSFANDATTNVSISTADGTNPRIDLIVAQVRDNTADGGGNNDGRLVAVTGTPGAVPAVPTVPAGCLVLAQVAVAAAVSSITNANITDKRTWVSAVGGTLRCLSTNRPSGASLREGVEILEIDTDRYLIYDGSAWIRTGWYSSAGRTGGIWTRNAVQSIGNATTVAVIWNNEVTDSDGFLTPSTATITVPAGLGGLYACAAEITYSGASLNQNMIRFLFSSITDPYEFVGTATLTGFQTASVVVPLAAGDTFQVSTFHTNGAALNIARARLDVYRIGP